MSYMRVANIFTFSPNFEKVCIKCVTLLNIIKLIMKFYKPLTQT